VLHKGSADFSFAEVLPYEQLAAGWLACCFSTVYPTTEIFNK